MPRCSRTEPRPQRFFLRGLASVAFAAVLAAVMGVPVEESLVGAGANGGTPSTNGSAGTVAAISGDLDCSGGLGAEDALHVLRYVAQIPGISDCLFAADVQCDNDRDAVDALLILRHIASLPATRIPPGCPGTGQPLPENPDLAGGVLVSAVAVDESYRVWLTNATGIAQVYDLAWGRPPLQRGGLFNGLLRSGPGKGEHNAPWTWHLDPEETGVAEGTIEECQGRPSFVEQNVEAWIELVGRFCPNVDQLVNVVDYRWMAEVLITD